MDFVQPLFEPASGVIRVPQQYLLYTQAHTYYVHYILLTG